jgi:hypothetical protein
MLPARHRRSRLPEPASATESGIQRGRPASRNAKSVRRDSGFDGRFGLRTGVQAEIAIPTVERGAQFSQELFRELELLVSQGRTYRGRIISLEVSSTRRARGSMVRVRRLGNPAAGHSCGARPQRGWNSLLPANSSRRCGFRHARGCYSTERQAQARHLRFQAVLNSCQG